MRRRAGVRRAGSHIRVLAGLTIVAVLAGCGHPESLTVATVPTLPPPTPVGMERMPPE
ncbi:MAG TPA: ABC transporter substrate-binding protein, partial [Mycobacterium sp.]|nr:ABC transporter substrate-binding protein [Mycobacterium sp.]